MQFIRDLSIRTKLTLVACVTGGAALLFATVATLGIQSFVSRQGFERDLIGLGKVIATDAAPTLAANDLGSAGALLATLRANPFVIHAEIVRPDDSEFARFDRVATAANGKAGKRVLETPILLEGKPVGTLRLAVDYRNKFFATTLQQGILAAALLCSLGAGLTLSRPLCASITESVLRLAATARGVVGSGRYSTRAEVQGADEVGKLAELFNQTLERVEELEVREENRDHELRRLKRELEDGVAGRKRAETALRESRQRYEVTAVAMLGSSDGLWDWDLTTNVITFSPQWKRMLGFEDEEVSNSYEAWINLLYAEDRDRVIRCVDDYLAGRTETFEVECRMRRKQGDSLWTLYRGAALRDTSGKPFRFAGAQTDITARKMAEAGMEQLHRQMVETSRFAGMAEVATGVLHNVGNVLNSVNVSATLVSDRLSGSRLPDLAAAAALFKEHAHDLPAFLSADPKGRVLPGYLRTGLEKINAEHKEMLAELDSLNRNIGHIKEVVSMQQTYARVSTPTETLTAAELVEEAVRISAAAFHSHPVAVVRRFQPVPAVAVDRHKAEQILINLLSNARHAMENLEPIEQRIDLTIETNERGAVTIAVRDNGIGISQENLTSVFRHGFTTRKEGHGFGLHSSANAAKQMGGSLGVWSDGPGQGACFILELPAATPAAEQKAA